MDWMIVPPAMSVVDVAAAMFGGWKVASQLSSIGLVESKISG